MVKRPRIRKATRTRIKIRDLCTCRECGRRAAPWWDEWQMGHIVPFSKGGRTFRNIALICRDCNLKIGASYWNPRPLSWWQHLIDWFLILTYDRPTVEDL